MSGDSEERFNQLIGRLPVAVVQASEVYWRHGFEGKGDPLSVKVEAPVGAGYTEGQKQLILGVAEDFFTLTDRISSETGALSPQQRPFIAIAGPGGSGKSTCVLWVVAAAANLQMAANAWDAPMLENVITTVREQTNLIYLNADRSFLGEIYRACCAQTSSPLPHDEGFYREWAWASRFLSSLVGAYAGHIPCIRDATFGSPGALAEVQRAHQAGRPTIITLVGADDRTRAESMRNRAAAGYVQSVAAVAEQQRLEFATNIPAICNVFDEVIVTHRFSATGSPCVAAHMRGNNVTVYDQAALDAFAQVYPTINGVLAQSTLISHVGGVPSLASFHRPFIAPLRRQSGQPTP